MVHQKAIALHHAALIEISAAIDDGIRLIQNGSVTKLCGIGPLIGLGSARQNTVKLQFRMGFPQFKDIQGSPSVCTSCHSRQKVNIHFGPARLFPAANYIHLGMVIRFKYCINDDINFVFHFI